MKITFHIECRKFYHRLGLINHFKYFSGEEKLTLKKSIDVEQAIERLKFFMCGNFNGALTIKNMPTWKESPTSLEFALEAECANPYHWDEAQIKKVVEGTIRRYYLSGPMPRNSGEYGKTYYYIFSDGKQRDKYEEVLGYEVELCDEANPNALKGRYSYTWLVTVDF